MSTHVRRKSDFDIVSESLFIEAQSDLKRYGLLSIDREKQANVVHSENAICFYGDYAGNTSLFVPRRGII